MLRMTQLTSAAQAAAYFQKSDGYYKASGLYSEVGGKGARHLGLDTVDYQQFTNLLNGLDPEGKQLTAKLQSNRTPGWDITASIPKGVTIALERGDERIHSALWEAGREAMADLEAMVETNLRGGRDGKGKTGNLIWYGFEHAETRPAKQDNKADPDRHIHFVVPNLTYLESAGQWQAIQSQNLFEMRKWFDRRFDSRLASKLTDLGYQIETKTKQGKYYSWDIKGIPESVVSKFSRRSAEVERLAEAMKIATPMGKDKLGATSRSHKREDMTLEDYRAYWASRITSEEGRKIAEVIKAALKGKNPKPTNTPDKAAAYAIDHHFYRSSVVPTKDLEITAMERSMGASLPDEILPELLKWGLLTKGEEATTASVLAEEGRIIAFAREGKGACRPMGVGPRSPVIPPLGRLHATSQRDVSAVASSGVSAGLDASVSARLGSPRKADTATLSPEQQAVCRHIWESQDRVILIEGDAGTGKTRTMQRTIPGISAPGVFLAPSSSASRGTLRSEGFVNADTIATFLSNPKFREQARNGYVYIDEAGLASIKDIDQVFGYAKQLAARVIIQGDRKQHLSPARHGNLFPTLENLAGLPVGRLKENRRQRNKDYREAVRLIAKGDILKGYDKLVSLGSVIETPVFDHNQPLVDDYLATTKAGKDVMIVAPTHAEKDEVTAALRERLKEEGILGEEKVFETLKPLAWTEAQKGDPLAYTDEVVQFHRNSGPFKAGQRVTADRLLSSGYALRPGHFSVLSPGSLAVAPGDVIRSSGNGWATDSKGKRHRIDNGYTATVKGVSEEGITLANGWFLSREFKTLDHGYVSTSFAAQGRTVDVVLAAMGHESLPAINAAQFYVTASRGREAFRMYTNVSAPVLREQIQKQDTRKSATELMGRHEAVRRPRTHSLLRRMRDYYGKIRDRLREEVDRAITEVTRSSNEGFAR